MKEGTAEEYGTGQVESSLAVLKKDGFLVSRFWELSVQISAQERIAYAYLSLVNARTAVILIGTHCSCGNMLSLFCEVLYHIAFKELVNCLSRQTSSLF